MVLLFNNYPIWPDAYLVFCVDDDGVNTKNSFNLSVSFSSNSYTDFSARHFPIQNCLVCEGIRFNSLCLAGTYRSNHWPQQSETSGKARYSSL